MQIDRTSVMKLSKQMAQTLKEPTESVQGRANHPELCPSFQQPWKTFDDEMAGMKAQINGFKRKCDFVSHAKSAIRNKRIHGKQRGYKI